MNSRLHIGDCLEIFRTLTKSSVDLIYLDPPFFTQKVHFMSTRSGDKHYSFDDLWASHSDYVNFLLERTLEMHRLLKDTGSLFFHCNDRSSHLARFVLDEIFGQDMFRSEIIWTYKRWSNSHKGLLPSHQTILFYSKTANFVFNQVSTEYSTSTNIDQILQKRGRDNRGKSVYAKDRNGQTISCGVKKGVPLGDVWDIPYLNPKAKERVGYPTQKPVLLLDRIVTMCSNNGDVILDPFCGSGTTLVAAALRGRRSIGIDCSADAIELAKKRLCAPVVTRSRLLERGRKDYIRKDNNLLDILEGIDFYTVQRNRGIDAILEHNYQGRAVFVRIQRPEESLYSAIGCLRKASIGKGDPLLILIATSCFDKNLREEDVIIIPSTSTALRLALQKDDLADVEKSALSMQLF